jgi:hypothetical protein
MNFSKFHKKFKLITQHLLTDYIIFPARSSHQTAPVVSQDEAYTTTPCRQNIIRSNVTQLSETNADLDLPGW